MGDRRQRGMGLVRAGAALACLLATAGAAAQETAAATRAERWRQRRLEKAEKVEPPHESRIAKQAKSFDRKGHDSIEDSSFKGFYPRFDWLAPGSGPAIGTRYWRPAAVDIMGSAFVSYYKYQLYDLSVGLIPNRGKRIPPVSLEREEVERLGNVDRSRLSRLKLFGTVRYRDHRRIRFYGIGPDSQGEDQVRFRLEDVLTELTAGWQFTDRLALTFKVGYLDNRLGSGVFDPVVPGVIDVADYARYRGTLLFDKRDEPGNPHSGFMLAAGIERHDQVDEPDRFSFWRYSGDARAFISLGSRQRVVALRAMAIASNADRNNRVPFFLMPTLGGSRTLRGLQSNRLRGEDAVLFQVEYRWEAAPQLEFALFVDSGTVSDRDDDLSLRHLNTSYGIGGRIKSSRSTLLRIDLAKSDETFRVLFRFGAAF